MNIFFRGASVRLALLRVFGCCSAHAELSWPLSAPHRVRKAVGLHAVLLELLCGSAGFVFEAMRTTVYPGQSCNSWRSCQLGIAQSRLEQPFAQHMLSSLGLCQCRTEFVRPSVFMRSCSSCSV